MIKNPPSNAQGTGSIPGWGTKITRALQQLSPSATAREQPAGHRERRRAALGPHAGESEQGNEYFKDNNNKKAKNIFLKSVTTHKDRKVFLSLLNFEKRSLATAQTCRLHRAAGLQALLASGRAQSACWASASRPRPGLTATSAGPPAPGSVTAG